MADDFRVGIDIGGTFTDIVFMNKQGIIFTRKVPSTPDDYTRAISSGVNEIFSATRLSGAHVAEVVHGTTVATNAVLEHTGSPTGLITTSGFRDVLEIRRFRMPELYNLAWEKPAPLAPRRFRLEVRERIDYHGEVQVPLDEEGVAEAVDRLSAMGVESVAVCLLNSYANPRHERRVCEIIHQRHPHLLATISSDLIPVIKEYERTSETVVNAYVRPIVIHYMKSLEETIRGLGIQSPLLVMQSSGGMMSAETAMERPIYIIECGPAAGVVGGCFIAKKLGIPNVLTLDMGGTTAKASIIEDFRISRAPFYEVGAGISMASRLCTGGGYVIRVPSIDIAEIGAGGGSMLWLDAGGHLRCGPRSAGASPGPVCYDLGGTVPTTTDANLVLGYINPHYLTDGSLRLNAARALRALEEQIADPMGMGVHEAAFGAYMISNSNMIRAIRAVSTERGRDPRDFVLFAFGGAGPIHAASLAREMEIQKVVVMPNPGLFSALGLLFSDIEHHLHETFFRRLDEGAVDAANQTWDTMKARAMRDIEAGGHDNVEIHVERLMDMRYAGQSSELTIHVPWESFTADHVPLLAERFNEEHLKTYAHKRADEPIDIINLRLVTRIRSLDESFPNVLRRACCGEYPGAGFKPALTPPTQGLRPAYFGKKYGWVDTRVLRMEDLSREPLAGPAIVELYDSTCVVPPGCDMSAGDWGTIVIDIKE